MNERLKEFAEQAWVYAEQNNPEPYRDIYDLCLEKFAELIVRECADRCEMSPYPHPNYSVAIKKHFGVEE